MSGDNDGDNGSDNSDAIDSETPSGIWEWTADWALNEGLKLWKTTATGSTNSIAKDDESPATKPRLEHPGSHHKLLHLTASEPTLYIARFQTQGRGRGTHAWLAPEGSALLSSWAFAMGAIPQPILSPLVGLALFEAALETWPEVAFNLKAPNDLFIGARKVAGLLIETVDTGVERRTVVGLGLNVTGCPAEVPTATCLAEHLMIRNQEAWRRFLSAWKKRLALAMVQGQESHLTTEAAERLRCALNRHPLLKEPIVRIDHMGQLHFASRLVPWHEL